MKKLAEGCFGLFVRLFVSLFALVLATVCSEPSATEAREAVQER